MVHDIEGDRDRRPAERALGLVAGLDGIHLLGEPFELPVRGERRGSPMDACHIEGLLVIIGLIFLIFGLIVVVMVVASGRTVAPVAACTATTALPPGIATTSFADTTTSAPMTVGAVFGNMIGLTACVTASKLPLTRISCPPSPPSAALRQGLAPCSIPSGRARRSCGCFTTDRRGGRRRPWQPWTSCAQALQQGSAWRARISGGLSSCRAR